jgi:hypothetical protein
VTFRVVLDSSAIGAFANASIHVGEVLAEIFDEPGATVGLPVEALTVAYATEPDTDRLDLLVKRPLVEVVPAADVDEWRRTANAMRLLGTFDRAVAALLVIDGEAAYVMTCDPDVYGGVPTLQVWRN